MKSNKQAKKVKSFKQKQTKYKRLVGFIPEAIILLSGGIVKEVREDEEVRYRSTKINEGDAFGILWGEARVLAVAELANYFPQAVIIVTSISFPFKELEELSISSDRIIFESLSRNTHTQIGEALRISKKKKIKKLVFVSNEYHLPRVRAIYENFESLGSSSKKSKQAADSITYSNKLASFVAAEDILPHRDKKFTKMIASMKKSPAYHKRVKNEKKGLSMLRRDEYGKKGSVDSDKSERVV